jgi:hypothetical protein
MPQMSWTWPAASGSVVSLRSTTATRLGDEKFDSPAPTQERSHEERPVVQRQNTRLITGRRRFDSFLADWRLIGTEVLAAERPALNRFGEGSSPSGPTLMQALVV